jgi:hypothetical protein
MPTGTNQHRTTPCQPSRRLEAAAAEHHPHEKRPYDIH